MTYRVVPYVYTAGRASIPDAVLQEVWEELHSTGRDRVVWYSGGVTSFETFLAFLRQPWVLPAFVIDTRVPCISLFAWLTELHDRTAKVHFCGLRRYHRGMGRAVLDYWDGFLSDDGEPLFRVLTGVTPESNENALRLVEIMGFTAIGTIPEAINLHYEGRRVGGVVSYRKGR